MAVKDTEMSRAVLIAEDSQTEKDPLSESSSAKEHKEATDTADPQPSLVGPTNLNQLLPHKEERRQAEAYKSSAANSPESTA